MAEKFEKGTLYIVATPIGNLGDITLRALDTLKSVDVIAAEDTRHTVKLLNHFDIKTHMISHHEHNEEESAKGILNLLHQGKNVALVTDAGMPCISDPGYKLVSAARADEITVTCLPGASALPAAIALSGLDTARFRFEGFLPKQQSKRDELLGSIAKDGCAVALYEAPHRLIKTAKDIAHHFPGRKVALINDISKLHERVEVYDSDNLENGLKQWNMKGEFVIVIEKGKASTDSDFSCLSLKDHVIELMDSGLSKMEAIKKVAKLRGIKKGEVYNESIDI